MDPDAILSDIRTGILEYETIPRFHVHSKIDAAEYLVFKFNELDECMKKGGLHPRDWHAPTHHCCVRGYAAHWFLCATHAEEFRMRETANGMVPEVGEPLHPQPCSTCRVNLSRPRKAHTPVKFTDPS